MQRWNRFPAITHDIRLDLIEYDFRDILEPLVEYISYASRVEFAGSLTTVVIPEFVPPSLVTYFLHNQTANILRLRLRNQENLVLIDVPYLIKVNNGNHTGNNTDVVK